MPGPWARARIGKADRVPEVCEITARYLGVNNAPVHAGDPATIGNQEINQPNCTEPVERCPGTIPVFWGWRVTPQALTQSNCPTADDHARAGVNVCYGPGG